ncbi:hypothetical protein ACWGDE_24175 [Streptomyces sp. NPDC054956]
MADGDIGDAAEPASDAAPGAAPASDAAPDAAPVERVHRLQRSMAGAAALLAAVMTLWTLFYPPAMILVLPFVAITWTLFLRDARAFRAMCRGVGAVVTVLGVVLACFGMFVMIPSAVILLLAASADPRRRPVLARVCAGLTAVTAVTVLVAVAPLARDVMRQPHAYSVVIPGNAYGDDGRGPASELWQYGVTGTVETGLDSGTRLEVTYDEDLTGAERAALRDYLAAIPGAGPVEACGRLGCG